MPSYEIRAIVEWSDEDGDHREVLVRDTEHHLYRRFEAEPGEDVVRTASKHLSVEEKEVHVPAHIDMEVRRRTGRP